MPRMNVDHSPQPSKLSAATALNDVSPCPEQVQLFEQDAKPSKPEPRMAFYQVPPGPQPSKLPPGHADEATQAKPNSVTNLQNAPEIAVTNTPSAVGDGSTSTPTITKTSEPTKAKRDQATRVDGDLRQATKTSELQRRKAGEPLSIAAGKTQTTDTPSKTSISEVSATVAAPELRVAPTPSKTLTNNPVLERPTAGAQHVVRPPADEADVPGAQDEITLCQALPEGFPAAEQNIAEVVAFAKTISGATEAAAETASGEWRFEGFEAFEVDPKSCVEIEIRVDHSGRIIFCPCPRPDPEPTGFKTFATEGGDVRFTFCRHRVSGPNRFSQDPGEFPYCMVNRAAWRRRPFDLRLIRWYRSEEEAVEHTSRPRRRGRCSSLRSPSRSQPRSRVRSKWRFDGKARVGTSSNAAVAGWCEGRDSPAPI